MRKFGFKSARARLVASVAMMAISAGMAFAEPEAVDLSLPEQPLADSLTDLSRRTGENILFQSEALAGVRAPALKGHMTPLEAIQRLIQGTGLQAVADGRGGVVVQRESFSEPVSPNLPAERQFAPLAKAGSRASVAQDADEAIEQVTVSASRVTIAGYLQPTPVTVIGAAQLQRDAYPSIQDSLSVLPQVTSPPASYNNINGLGGGGSSQNTINLRDIGVARTLVLFDNQRTTITGLKGGVDTSTLPAMMVSRVDVVTAGASAAWGSDAVAGVVNFILNKNFTGFKATVQGGDTYNGLYRTMTGEAAWGDDLFGGRGHFEVAANAVIKPDTVILSQENWYRDSYFVSNPAYVAGNGQPQLIMANNVGLANLTPGGIINSSPAVSAASSPTGTAIPANVLRGIEFVGAGIPQVVNYGNVTSGTLSNGGSLTQYDTWGPLAPVAMKGNTYTFFAYGRYKLTGTIQASAQLNASYISALASSGPANQSALVIKSDNAYIPASVSAVMQADGIPSFTLGTLTINNYSNNNPAGADFTSQAESGLGPVYAKNRRNMLRGVFTLDGTIGDDWSWDAYVQHSAIRYTSTVRGIEINANLAAAQDAVVVTAANRGSSNLALGSIVCRSSLPGQAAVMANGITAQPNCVPLDVFGEDVASQAAIGYLSGAENGTLDQAHEGNGQDTFDGSMQGTLPWQLPAGKIAVAFGGGYRKEYGWEDGNPIGNVNGYSNGNFPPIARGTHYTVMEGFGEIDAPILKNNIVNSLDLSMAGRMTSYSTSGLVETWKIGATSQVNDDIRLRVTTSVDIRAPQISELYTQSSIGFGTQIDPRTENSVANVITNTQGNPNLVPEVAHTITGGMVLTPTFIPGLSLSADWYSVDIKAEIASVTAQQILAACDPTLASPTNPGHNGNMNDPLCSHLVFGGVGGALSQINVSVVNIASGSVSGLDLQANYIMDFLGGSLAWSGTGSYMDENTTTAPGVAPNDIAGSNDVSSGNPGNLASPGPKWRGIISATYSSGPYSFTVQSRWFGTSVSYQNGNTGNQSTAANALLYDPAHFEVPATAYLDLRANYKWNENISLFGAIDNTLNTPPPLVLPATAGAVTGGPGFYNTNQYVFDMLGRTFRAGIRFNY